MRLKAEGASQHMTCGSPALPIGAWWATLQLPAKAQGDRLLLGGKWEMPSLQTQRAQPGEEPAGPWPVGAKSSIPGRLDCAWCREGIRPPEGLLLHPAPSA